MDWIYVLLLIWKFGQCDPWKRVYVLLSGCGHSVTEPYDSDHAYLSSLLLEWLHHALWKMLLNRMKKMMNHLMILHCSPRYYTETDFLFRTQTHLPLCHSFNCICPFYSWQALQEHLDSGWEARLSYWFLKDLCKARVKS